MTADDKLGLGFGSLALGLAGSLFLLAQVLPNGLSLFPHRELFMAEAILDGVVFVLSLPVGIYLLYQGFASKNGT
jgi:hypothetical protein